MFKVYKPKGDRVKAVQVTTDTLEEIAETLMGRLVWPEPGGDQSLTTAIGVEIPTLDGNTLLRINMWVVRANGSNKVKFLTDEEFEQTYEPVRTVNTR